MVVLEHEHLHKTLWGPAAPRGRSARTDAAVYAQLVLFALLGIGCALEYEKPAAVRLGATAAGTLLYFRNTALFVRLMLLVACLALYGDVFVPLKRLATGSQDVSVLLTAKLALNIIALMNTTRILYAVLSSGALRSSNNGQRPTRMVKSTARYAKHPKAT